jgi:hypothetical protein
MPQDKARLLQMLVLNEIADDYENFTRIFEGSAREGRRCGVVALPADIVRALSELVVSGLAGKFRLSPTQPAREAPDVSPEDALSDHSIYFLITRRGREVLDDDALWPFDEHGQIR